jgi:5-methylcytosine-specific restriction endonuclease McrA
LFIQTLQEMARVTIKAKDVDWVAVQKHYDEGFSSRVTATAFSLTRGQWDAAVERGDLRCRKMRLFKSEEVFVVGPIVSGTWLKKRLLKEGLIEDRCEICGLVEWMGRRLALQIDHINGDRRDNRVENLRLLCPNCHSQTDTYCGRNIKKPYQRQAVRKFHLVVNPTENGR